VYPHLRKDHAKRWWDATVRLSQQVARGAVQAAKTLFMLNGKPLDYRQMRRQLGQQLGGGFQDDGATARISDSSNHDAPALVRR
jgi:phage gpG-like protein